MGNNKELSLTDYEHQRLLLPLKAVRLFPLDEFEQDILRDSGGVAAASGFIRTENFRHFLYTCWHVATGLDPCTRALPPSSYTRPRKIRVQMQHFEVKPGHIEQISGSRSFIVDLYDPAGVPLWDQDRHYVPNEDLNAIGIRFPFEHDAIRLPLPGLEFAQAQCIQEFRPYDRWILPGQPIFVVGYSNGYTALENPTPVVLHAHIAASLIKERRNQFLIDRPGAPVMSGGPVFLEGNSHLWLIGLYTGVIWTIHGQPASAAFGSCAPLLDCWKDLSQALIPASSTDALPRDGESGEFLGSNT